MNVKQVKRSMSVIMDIRSQTSVVLQRARKAEDMFKDAVKELETCKTLLDSLAVDLAGHASTYLYLLQHQESAAETSKGEAA